MESMHRTYTMRLKVTKRQDETLARLLGQLCELYNMALQQKRTVYRELRAQVSRYDQQKQLTELRNNIEEYAEFSATIQRDSLIRIERAYKGFYSRIKSGLKAGLPRYRSLSRYDSFKVEKRSFHYAENMVTIAKLGTFKTKTHCHIKGTPVELRVKRCGQKWQAQLVCEIGSAPEKVAIRNAIGIDLGITSLITLSNGTEIANPCWTKQDAERAAEANRSLRRKEFGSKNRSKAKERLRRILHCTAAKRTAYLHNVSSELVKTYDLIAYEHLDIERLASGDFARTVYDASWGQLIHQIKYKAEYAGTYAVAVTSWGTSQFCSGCRKKVPKELRQRKHSCPHCGLSLGRDHNAALNVLDRGMRSAGVSAVGLNQPSTPKYVANKTLTNAVNLTLTVTK
jgi:putative transposase